jgi:hypothetical protein
MEELSFHISKPMTLMKYKSKLTKHFGLGKNYRNIDMFISWLIRNIRRR